MCKPISRLTKGQLPVLLLEGIPSKPLLEVTRTEVITGPYNYDEWAFLRYYKCEDGKWWMQWYGQWCETSKCRRGVVEELDQFLEDLAADRVFTDEKHEELVAHLTKCAENIDFSDYPSLRSWLTDTLCDWLQAEEYICYGIACNMCTVVYGGSPAPSAYAKRLEMACAQFSGDLRYAYEWAHRPNEVSNECFS